MFSNLRFEHLVVDVVFQAFNAQTLFADKLDILWQR